jgi:hypothetical protein
MQASDDIGSFSATHLPIVKEYAHRMGLVRIIDDALACGMHVSPGSVVLALIMNVRQAIAEEMIQRLPWSR